MKPPRICSCGKVVPKTELCACERKRKQERNNRHDQNRPRASARGYGSKWRKLRDAFLMLYPWCRKCGNRATVVDHIIPHKGNETLFWDQNNWQPLCKSCHDRDKQKQERNQ